MKFLKKLKRGFKRIFSWKKYRSEITKQNLIDPTFWNISSRSFVISFKNGDDDPTRLSFDEYYMPLIEIKGFNALIDKKHF